MNKKVLAWYQYPEPGGKNYNEDDLSDPDILEQVFDYAQLYLAAIFASGWAFILDTYSYEQLAEIDSKSGWFHPCDMDEFIESLEYQALISGYNPETKQFGKYDEESGTFTPL